MISASLGRFKLATRCAATFAALFVCAPFAQADTVVFRSSDNAVSVEGRFVAFDGETITVMGPNGPLSFRADGMACDGLGCPDLKAYVPRLRMVGSARMADILIPALIDAYGRDKMWTVQEDAYGLLRLDSNGDPQLEINLSVADATAAFGVFAEQKADVLLSVRELTAAELRAGRDAGLGHLGSARQGRILALDALVPVTSTSSDWTTVDMATLTAAFAGTDDALSVARAESLEAQLDGFENRFMAPFDLSFATGDAAFDAVAEVTNHVAQTEDKLALVPYGQTGMAQPLGLDGPCGLTSRADFLSLKTEDYPLTFPMFLYLPQRNRHPQVDAFLDWMRSPAAQLVIRRAGFVDLAAVPIPLADQGDRLAAAIGNAGEEVPLTELQRMVRVLSPQVRMSSTFRFEPGSTRLDGQSRSNVMQLAQSVRDGRFGGSRLMFVGFSDGLGPAETNRDLSAERADAVRRAVEAALGGHIPSNVTFEIEAFGEALPMACDDTVWGQQTNRRVELWLSDAE